MISIDTIGNHVFDKRIVPQRIVADSDTTSLSQTGQEFQHINTGLMDEPPRVCGRPRFGQRAAVHHADRRLAPQWQQEAIAVCDDDVASLIFR